MKYFVMKEPVIGNVFPQVHKYIKGYDPEAHHALFSLYDYVDSLPDYVPDLDGMMLAGSAKLTDFLSSAFTRMFIMSEKAKSVLEQYHLPLHQFYPLGLYKRKIKHDYFLFKYVSNYSDFVDYERTSFKEEYLIRRYDSMPFFIKSKEEYWERRQKIKAEKGDFWTISGDKIVMNKDFDHELDFFEICILDSNTYVSERLKNAIEAAGLTGWEFTPATNLIVED